MHLLQHLCAIYFLQHLQMASTATISNKTWYYSCYFKFHTLSWRDFQTVLWVSGMRFVTLGQFSFIYLLCLNKQHQLCRISAQVFFMW